MATVDWWRPPLVGYPAAMDSVSVVAAPLLAGFSITLVGVVAQASANFAVPAVAMMTLSVAAIFFVASVQCGYWARQYLASPADLAAWDLPGTNAQKHEQAEHSLIYEAWRSRAANTYSTAVVLLTAGLAVALVPRGNDDTANYIVRWVAVGLVALAFLLEVGWIAGPDRLHQLAVFKRSKTLKTASLNWFYPARDRKEGSVTHD